MKKFLTMLLSGLCFLTGVCFAGCSGKENVIIPTGNYYSDEEGIYLTIGLVDSTDEHTKLNVKWHNETDYEVIYVLPYYIEYKNGEEWTNINTADPNYDLTEMKVAPHSTRTQVYTTAYFDVSKTGTYRLRTDCVVLATDMPSCNLWVEFEVKASSQTKSHKVTARLGDWLYGSLKSRYKEGENVVVKIGIAYDIGFSLYMNGRKLQQDPHESGRDYWQYTFTMPGEDVVLTYKTSDGMKLRPIIEQVEDFDSVAYRFASDQEHLGCLLINGTEVKEYTLSFNGMYFAELTDRAIEDPEANYRLLVSGDLNFQIRLYSKKMFVLDGKLYEIFPSCENDFSAIFEDHPL